MKPELRFEYTDMHVAALGSESSVPDLLGEHILQNVLQFDLNEYAELYQGYGRKANAYPYRQYACYSRELSVKYVKTAVLENEYLKAVFLPEYGGRLWSLTDKVANRNLLYTNDVIRFSNLATRNAWFSGGVEWNMGIIGHTPFTAAPLYTAKTQTESGNPVLRMYEYERIRCAAYQMDFWLEEDSPFLNCRMRVVNESDDVIPMYWWSNIAVPEYDNGRIIVPAEKAFTVSHNTVYEKDIPYVNGVDITDYKKIPDSVDYFFEINEGQPKYIANVDGTGYGLIHTSTDRLKSRKLFSWGNNDASDRWQEFLTEKAGRYIEIQAGLAKTQYGCLPMAPHTAWEWMEQYGAIRLDAGVLEKPHDIRVKTVTELLTAQKRGAELQAVLNNTRTLAKTPAELILTASGYGALAEHRTYTGHLAFTVHDTLLPWQRFIETGILHEPDPNRIPDEFFADDRIFRLLEQYVKKEGKSNWYAFYHLGIGYYIRGDMQRARTLLKQSFKLKANAWSLHALSCTEFRCGNKRQAAAYITAGMQVRKKDVSYLKEGCKILFLCGKNDDVCSLYESLDAAEQGVSRLKLYYISALHKKGAHERAFTLLEENGGLELEDVREGEVSIAELWESLYRALYGHDKAAPHAYRFRAF